MNGLPQWWPCLVSALLVPYFLLALGIDLYLITPYWPLHGHWHECRVVVLLWALIWIPVLVLERVVKRKNKAQSGE